MMKYVEQATSTNTLLMQRCLSEPLPNLYTLYTFDQTAGRGQQGNGWECAPGQNLAFTMLFRDVAVLPRLNQLVPLAVRRALLEEMAQVDSAIKWPGDLTIKWPNDIYVGDRKLGGILIENVIQGGRVVCSIAGVGLNIEQTEFQSAPNPVSLAMMGLRSVDKHALMARIQAVTEDMLPLLDDPAALKRQYMACLYRREGWHLYRERQAGTSPVMPTWQQEGSIRGRIVDVDEDGRLVLEQEDGSRHSYLFKEIAYVLQK